MGTYLGIFLKNLGESEDYIPVLPYLADITMEMLTFGEEIGNLIFHEYTKRHGAIPHVYVSLEGVCIPTFVEFLGLKKE